MKEAKRPRRENENENGNGNGCSHQTMTERMLWGGQPCKARSVIASAQSQSKKRTVTQFLFHQQQQKRGAGLAGPLPRSPPPAAKQARAIEASTRAHAPQAISNPLTPTTRQLQKPNPLPDLLFSPSTSHLQQHLLASHQLTQRTSSYSIDTTNPHFFQPLHLSKWLPRLLTRSPPPRLPLLPPRLLRRRMLARRLPPLVTRRSAPRPARRPTLLTSTRVSSNSHLNRVLFW